MKHHLFPLNAVHLFALLLCLCFALPLAGHAQRENERRVNVRRLPREQQRDIQSLEREADHHARKAKVQTKKQHKYEKQAKREYYLNNSYWAWVAKQKAKKAKKNASKQKNKALNHQRKATQATRRPRH